MATQLLLVRARVDDVQQQVGAPRLLQRRAEGVDELVRQLADEPDGVRDEVRAALEPQRPRRRVERVEEPVAHADLAAGERVEQRRLARVRVAGERDRRQVRALALGAHAPRGWRRRRASRRRSAAIRSRARRRSVSICDSPGPRVPMPPPRRSRCVHSPRMRARLYSSWASSTWSLPSAEWAWPAKMSRITAVRSITGTPSSFSRLRSWRGLSSSSQATRFASAAADERLDLLDLARPEVEVGVRLVAPLDQLADDRDARRCAAAP